MFAEADANSDGALDTEEWTVYGNLWKEWFNSTQEFKNAGKITREGSSLRESTPRDAGSSLRTNWPKKSNGYLHAPTAGLLPGVSTLRMCLPLQTIGGTNRLSRLRII